MKESSPPSSPLSLEEILQKHFNLEGNLLLQSPRKTDDRIYRWTVKGYKAYDRLVECLEDMVKISKVPEFTQCVGDIIEDFDSIEYEGG